MAPWSATDRLCLEMWIWRMESTELALTEPVEDSMLLRLTIAAYLARYKGQSRTHAETDLRSFIGWAADHRLHSCEPSAHISSYLRWLQEVRRYKSSTVSRRISVLAGFYVVTTPSSPEQLLATGVSRQPTFTRIRRLPPVIFWLPFRHP
jgi:hypothetical protein